MFCSKCGKAVDNDAKFCESCGAPQTSQQSNLADNSAHIIKNKSKDYLSNFKGAYFGFAISIGIAFLAYKSDSPTSSINNKGATEVNSAQDKIENSAFSISDIEHISYCGAFFSAEDEFLKKTGKEGNSGMVKVAIAWTKTAYDIAKSNGIEKSTVDYFNLISSKKAMDDVLKLDIELAQEKGMDCINFMKNSPSLLQAFKKNMAPQ